MANNFINWQDNVQLPSMTTSHNNDIGIAHNVNISRITLYNHMGEKIDLKEIFLEMNIYNSMFSPGIHGNILIQDANSLITRFPIIGEEKIEIEWNTPGNVSKLFVGMVFETPDIAPDHKGSKSSYVLRFCSEEVFQDAGTYVAKAYTNTLTANLIVEDIIKTYLNTTKPLFVDPCREIQKTLIIPYLQPYDAIEFLRQRVKTTDEGTTDYFEFFERFDGIHFRNITNIVKNPLNKEQFFYEYISDKFSNQRDSAVDMHRIINLRINNTFNTLSKISEGMFNNENFEYSFDDKKIYSETKYYKDYTPLLGDARMNTDAFVDKYATGSGYGLNGSITTFKERRVDQNFNFGKPGGMFLINRLALNQISITITVPGDSVVDIGDICYVNIPEFTSDNDEVEYNMQLSGKYIIGSVRNLFLTPDKHTMQLDLYKDGYGTIIEGMSQSLKDIVYK